MTPIPAPRLETLFRRFSGLKILVIGDLMLDRYLWGRVARLSPEAPVPVVEIESESSMLGGAANVSSNVRALGAAALPMGVVGGDPEGEALRRLFMDRGFPVEGIVTDPGRPTTVKTRVIAHHQHLVRADREVRNGLSTRVVEDLAARFDACLEGLDGIILEDYNKGLLVPEFINHVTAAARRRGKPVFVDPKFDHFFEYRGVTLFKPNRKEASDRLGFRLDDEAAQKEALDRLLERLDAGSVLITLGEEGMILKERGGDSLKVPTRAVKVHDVSGAGDTVIAVMAVALCAGASFAEAAEIANHAAGIVCGEVGIVPVDSERLRRALLEEARA